uniref:Uncharacterized protein n=1 Tax=Arundo donax TaxID=35708 RepID=A0A0A9G0J1_ARUDO
MIQPGGSTEFIHDTQTSIVCRGDGIIYCNILFKF